LKRFIDIKNEINSPYPIGQKRMRTYAGFWNFQFSGHAKNTQTNTNQIFNISKMKLGITFQVPLIGEGRKF